MASEPRSESKLEQPVTFAEVGAREAEHIKARRRACGVTSHVDGRGEPSHRFGVALSGGGIRAAAVSLGALDALARHDLLKHVDYLSSVSGGGFAAAAVLSSTPADQPLTVSPAALARLRTWSSYLAPGGLFSASGFSLFATYLFGLFLNLAYYVGLTGVAVSLWLALISIDDGPAHISSAIIGSLGLSGLLSCTIIGAVRASSNEAGGRYRREWQQRGLVAFTGAVLLLALYWASHAAAGWLWSNRGKLVAQDAEGLWQLVGASVASLIAFVPSLAKRVYGTLHDSAAVLRKQTQTLIQLGAFAVLAAALLFHTSIWLLLRVYLHAHNPHGVSFGFLASALAADAVNASALLLAASLAVGLVAWFIRQFLAYEQVSLHFFFRDRIAEAFVLATGGRISDPNLKLASLAERPHAPYWILNATLNVRSRVAENRDALRRAVPFELAVGHCGFGNNGAYRPTERYAGGLALSTAVAISAAAIAPRMGFYTRGLLPVLMSMLNLRLGVRLPNPNRPGRRWYTDTRVRRPSLFYSEDSPSCYVSDGGHFDNLGLYALLRRRCRYILAIDAEADGRFGLGGLGAVTRLARADLNCNLALDVSQLRPDANGMAKATCAIGRFTFDDDPGFVGTIIYVKAGFVAGLPPDLLAYRAHHGLFPHEGTGDQFFDEAQFEAYRRLGYELMERSLAAHDPAQPFRGLARLFVDMQDELSTAGAAATSIEAFHNTTERFIELEAIASEVSDEYDRELYPELTREVPRRDVHFILSQIQLMEQVFVAVQLERTHARTENAGWMRLFARYARSATFRAVWLEAGDGFSNAFHRFCEHHFGLPVPRLAHNIGVVSIALNRLRSDEPVRWSHASTGQLRVCYEIAIAHLRDDVWVERPVIRREAPWLASDEAFQGDTRVVVRALGDGDRELAIGEVSVQTYRTSIDRMRARNRLLIGIYIDGGGSPACFRRAPDRPFEGFDVELARELTRLLAAELEQSGLEAELVPFSWPALLEQPALHTVDFVLASVTKSPERSAHYQLAFTEPYHEARTLLVHRGLELPGSFDAPDQEGEALAKLELGVMVGTTAASYLAELGLTPRTFSTLDELAGLLADGKLDGVVCDGMQCAVFDEPNGKTTLRARLQPYAIALAPLNRELEARLNGYLTEIRGRNTWFTDQMQAASAAYIAHRRSTRHSA